MLVSYITILHNYLLYFIDLNPRATFESQFGKGKSKAKDELIKLEDMLKDALLKNKDMVN